MGNVATCQSARAKSPDSHMAFLDTNEFLGFQWIHKVSYFPIPHLDGIKEGNRAVCDFKSIGNGTHLSISGRYVEREVNTPTKCSGRKWNKRPTIVKVQMALFGCVRATGRSPVGRLAIQFHSWCLIRHHSVTALNRLHVTSSASYLVFLNSNALRI